MGEGSSIDNHFSLKILRFFMRLVGMWPVDNSRDQLISDMVLFYTMGMVIIALLVLTFDFYHSWGDLHAISYIAPTTITVIVELVKLTKFVVNRYEVMDFNAYTEKIYWKFKYETAELEILNKCNYQSMKIGIIYICFIQSVVFTMLSVPFFELAGNNSSERVLPFYIYLDLPLTQTPYYEIAFILETFAGISVGISIMTFSNFLCTINVYAAGQCKILQRKLRLSCTINDVTVAYTILKNCIRQHQALIMYMERVENLFNVIMLAQALGSVMEICFSGFQILLGADTSILRTILSVGFFISALIKLLLFSWSSHEIIIESQEIAEAAYQGTWHDLPYASINGKKYRQCLLIIIARAHKPCILTVGKFAPMSLNTFTSVFNTAISYFTILRQMNEDMDE